MCPPPQLNFFGFRLSVNFLAYTAKNILTAFLKMPVFGRMPQMLKTWVFNNIHIFSNKAYLPSKQPIFVENLLFVENYVERLLKSWKNRWKNGKICGSSFLNYSFHWFLIFEFNIWYLIFDYGYFCYAFLMAKNKYAINRTGFKNFFFQWRIYKKLCAYFPRCCAIFLPLTKILWYFSYFSAKKYWQKEKYLL